MDKIERSIYIHVPFCRSKCFYCDFYSITDTSYSDSYLNSLLKEIAYYSGKRPRQEIISTIFIGGGTPSLLSDKAIESILFALWNKFDIAPDAEITIEANPGTLDAEKLNKMLACGINRISMGVQSFDDKELKFLQRIHDSRTAVKSFEKARKAGFANISIDLISSLPGQEMVSWKNNLEKAVALAPDHISAYSLIYEKGTPLYSSFQQGKITPVSDDTDSEMYLFTGEFLSANNLNQYEISNYSLPGYECRHNLNYWRRKEYYGFGPAAHGFINGQRYSNFPDIHKYIREINTEQLPVEKYEQLSKEDIFFEIIYLGLRAEGINLNDLSKLTGSSVSRLLKYFNSGYFDDLLVSSDSIVKLTAKGFAFCDNITVKILNDLKL